MCEKLTGKNILLGEDHPLNAEIAIRLLRRVGCTVEWLKNGEEAVCQFTDRPEKQYDPVLMGIRMPVMDGLEATRKICALDSGYAKVVPIIAMTANAYEDDIRHSMEAGMNEHLSKPIDMNAFYTTLVKNTQIAPEKKMPESGLVFHIAAELLKKECFCGILFLDPKENGRIFNTKIAEMHRYYRR